MTHAITTFNHDGAYRGASCTCGFTASTGDIVGDYRHCLTHLETELAKELTLHKETKRILDKLTNLIHETGSWDDGCFYYHGHSAPELEGPLTAAEAHLKQFEKEKEV